jgi:diacylglycerol kinase family enzyme
MRSAAFVINRTLVRDPLRFAGWCRSAARAVGWEPVFAETSLADSGLGLARQAVAAGASLVFAAGGDGTVRACAQALAGTGIPLAIVPLGTANLTARALGIPGRADRAIDTGFRGRDRVIDLALAQADDGGADGADLALADQGGAGGIGFTAMAGIGLDAAVVEAARSPVKRRLGWVAYAVSGLAHLSLPAAEFTIRLDGGQPLRRRARCVVVGNAGLLPGGFVLLPGARLDDGRLDVGILAPAGVFGWPRAAGRVLTRSRGQDRTLERFQARRVEIAAEADLPRQIDGEVIAAGQTLTVSVCPGALTVRQPR